MPGRVELDLVDPVAETVEGLQPRWKLVRIAAGELDVRFATDFAQGT